MFGPDPTPLHPDPDTATATVIEQFNDSSHLAQARSKGEPADQAQARAVNNMGILMSERGLRSDTPYMRKALYRRACLQEAAYIRIMERLTRESHFERIKKLTAAASDLHKSYLATLGAIYKLERDPDPILVRKDYQAIDEPLPPEAIKVLGVAGAVAVEMFNESTNDCSTHNKRSTNNNNESNAMEKLRTIRMYGKLGAKYGRVHQLYISSAREAIRALSCQLLGFHDDLRDSDQHGVAYAVFLGKRNIDESELDNPPGDDDIRIAPILQGYKKAGLFQTILGAVLIAAAFIYTGGAAAGLAVGTIGGTALTAGVGLVLGGMAQLLSPQPRLELDYGDGKRSTAFSGPVNNVVAGVPVPIAIGEVIVGSSVISASIVAEDAAV